MICVHCERRAANRPRGLCWPCYNAPGVREQYGSAAAKFGKRGAGTTGKKPPPPTEARPGSEEKILELQRRAEAEELLFHPADKQLSDE